MILFCLFVILKQFYLQTSGNIGIADICLMACFVTTAIKAYRLKNVLSIKRDRLLYGFLVMVVAVNMIYGVHFKNLEYLKYSVYWIYNGCAIWSWRILVYQHGFRFLKSVNVAVKFNIIVQFVVWLTGHGRLFKEYWGGVRYMGTFNDPNQMAFFIFMMLLIIWLYRCRYRDRSFWIFLVLALPILADSKSTGVWLGLLVWAVFCLAYGVYLLWKSGRVSGKLLLAAGACLLFAAAMLSRLIWPPADFDIRLEDYNLLTRIQEKIWKVMDGGIYGLFMDRAWGRLLLHPRYLLMGAGEGGFGRFADAGPVNELHSTWFSIWFCYGTIPMMMIIWWLRSVLRANTPWMRCAVGALLVESIFLINYRQPMFWMILLYADVTAGRILGDSIETGAPFSHHLLRI